MANSLEKKFFMLWKLKKDLLRDQQIYQLSEDLHSQQLGEYYFIMTEEQMRAGHSQQFHFDVKGVPIIPSYIDVEEKKMVYYPISIGQYGLAIWHSYLKTKSDLDRKRFLTIADWFYENRIEDPHLGSYWLTDVDKPAYRIKKPWKSAFSQARAVNILLRSYQLTAEDRYRQTAERALLPFQFPVKEGGVTTFLQEGPFYEEYPSPDIPVLVLNGMIFSLCGIYDFLRVFPNHSLAQKIYNEGIATLIKILPQFDMGYWSKYSLCEAEFHPAVDPATIGYHHLHIIQLELMHQLTGQELFTYYSQQWKNYHSFSNIIKMYWLKYRSLKKMKRL
jgi:heparosan-N-sulfate-glucuronate 5-epimerase